MDTSPKISPKLGVALAMIVGATIFLLVGEPPSLSFVHIKYIYYGLLVGLPALVVMVAGGGALAERSWTTGRTWAVLFAAALFGTYVWASHIEPYMLEVRTVEITSDAVSEPIEIVHISDIQTPTIGDYEREAFRTIASLEPDLVVHTGDVLQPPTPDELDKVAALFASLDPTYGVYNVPGDVDSALTAADWARFDQAAGVTTLINETTVVETNAGPVRLMGLDGPMSRLVRRGQVRSWVERDDPQDAFDVILGHAPDYILNIRGEAVDLALAGHTHGGQVRVPLYGAPVTLSQVPREWAFSHHVVDGTHLNVTSGVGAERAHGLPRIRFNCRPEVVLIQVVPQQ